MSFMYVLAMACLCLILAKFLPEKKQEPVPPKTTEETKVPKAAQKESSQEVLEQVIVPLDPAVQEPKKRVMVEFRFQPTLK